MESSASVGKSTGPRTCRRSWTPQEEQVLLNALKELVATGWKCDNGFKNGYQFFLEKSVHKALPGTDLKAEPHIASKIHVWKKNYGSLAMMLRSSGFGWNDTTNTILVDTDKQWNDYVKTDSNAKTMRYKSWPLFKDWSEIFGKDRATGENAQVFADVVQEVFSGGQSAGAPSNPQNYTREQTPPIPISEPAVGDTNSTCRGESSSTHKNKKSKKRRPENELEGRFLDVMKAFCEETNRQLGQLAERIGFDQDESKKRQAVFDALKEMNFLTVEDKLVVAKQLCNNNKDLDLFFSLTDDLKPVMVKMMIEGRL